MPLKNSGSTLIEVMVATVLAALLILGSSSLLFLLEQHSFRLTLKQKAVFLLQGELERLVTLYQKEFFYYKQTTFADNGALFGRWLYRAHPQGMKCPLSDANCFLVASRFDSAVTKDQWPLGKVLFLDYDTTGNGGDEVNLVWLDRARNVTARFHWTLGEMQATTGSSCCQTLQATLEFPYRFVEGVTPYQTSMGNRETVTSTTLVCGKLPFPAPVPRTGADTTSVATLVNDGEDGDWQKGIPWPDPRFTAKSDGTVIDNLTGLLWTKNADCWGALAWGDSTTLQSKVNQLNTQQGGCAGYSGVYTDWHLANNRELLSLVNVANVWMRSPVPPDYLPVGHPFENLTNGRYQSSTTMNDYWGQNHYNVLLKQALTSYTGFAPPIYKDTGTEELNPHWLVRVDTPTDLCAYPAPVPKTGNQKNPQTIADAFVKAGIPRPTPRFQDNGDETVTDNLTGLMWSKDGDLGSDCQGPERDEKEEGCVDSTLASRSDAYASIATCNRNALGGYRDWRLPNYLELESLRDFGVYPIDYNHPFRLPNNFFLTNPDFYAWGCFPYLSSDTSPAWTGGGSNPPGLDYATRVDYLVAFRMDPAILLGSRGFVWAVRGGP